MNRKACHLHIVIIFFPFPICLMFFFFFSCLTAMAKTSSRILKINGESKPFSDLRVKVFSFSLVNMMLAVGLLISGAAVTIYSDFRASQNKIYHCFHFSHIYLLWSDGTRCHDLSFWNVDFTNSFFTHLFYLTKRLFSSTLLFAIKMVSYAYLRILIFLLVVLLPAFDSSSLAFCMMHSACKLNKHSDNILLWHSSFPILK